MLIHEALWTEACITTGTRIFTTRVNKFYFPFATRLQVDDGSSNHDLLRRSISLLILLLLRLILLLLVLLLLLLLRRSELLVRHD